ncbi:MAG TPA: hypothetical protein VLY85_00560, partial [Thermoplasmata archaeon]|nr:hypothetical protein [Thermoplasmata archaeon]
IATLCALLAPIALVIAQPSALTADTHGGMVPSTGPWVSFVGTDSVSSMTLTWGPYFGWYLAWMAGALLLIGAVLFGRKYVAQRALEAPEAAEAPMGGDGELYGASGPYRAPTEPADYGADPGPDPPQV